MARPTRRCPRYVARRALVQAIAALDKALEEGYWSGSTTLIAGPAGGSDWPIQSFMAVPDRFADVALGLDRDGSPRAVMYWANT